MVGRQLMSGMQVDKTHAEEFNLRRELSRSSAQEATGPRGDYTGHRSQCTDVHKQKKAKHEMPTRPSVFIMEP